jgi:N-acyl-D-amino-acid deacylase
VSLDLVIRNGTVVDGSGGEPVRADVGISNGIITEVGQVDGPAHQSIDADGHVVTPGFIDGHTHLDAQFFWDPLGSSSCWHGVTTVVMGNCGFTLAPVRPGRHDLVVRNLERAEDMAPEALAAGIDWSWESFPEYLDAVDRLPKAINIAANVGHSALRTWAMGERAFDGPATDDHVLAMQRHLAESLAAGAIGFTTSRSGNHETSDDRPVASRLADWDEVTRLVAELSRVKQAVFELAVEPALSSPDEARRRESAGRLRELALRSRVRTTFGVAASNADTMLALIDETVAAGGRMFGQSHSRGINSVMSFRSQLPFDALPAWQAFRKLPIEGQGAALSDPPTRAALRDAAIEGPFARRAGAEVPPPDYDRMQALTDPAGVNPTVAQLARERGIHPVDVILDLALVTDFHQLFVQPLTALEPADLLAIMRRPNTVMTFSDSGAHVSQIADSSIQTYLLAHWVRGEQAFTLAEAVRMITSAPAQAWCFADRGLIKVGYRADVNVFDPDTVAPAMPELVNDLPAGAQRLRQGATGFLATIVGGEVILNHGQPTGARPGRLVRRGW